MTTKRSISEVYEADLFSELNTKNKPGKILQKLDEIERDGIEIDFNKLDSRGNTFLLKSLKIVSEAILLRNEDKEKLFLNIATRFLDLDKNNVMAGIANNRGYTPLMRSLFFKNSSLYLRLINLGQACNPSAVGRDDGYTALMISCGLSYRDDDPLRREAILKLIEIVDPQSISLVNSENDTALTLCCRHRYYEEVPLALIRTGHSNPGHVNLDVLSYGGTALCMAVGHELWKVAIELIKTPGSNVEFTQDPAISLEYFGEEFTPITAFDDYLNKIYRLCTDDSEYLIEDEQKELLADFIKYFYEKNLTENDALISTLTYRYVRVCCANKSLKKILSQKFGEEFVERICRENEENKPISAPAILSVPEPQGEGPLVLRRPDFITTVRGEDPYRNDPPRSRSPSQAQVHGAAEMQPSFFGTPRRASANAYPNAYEFHSALVYPATPQDDNYRYPNPNRDYQDQYVPTAGPKRPDARGGKYTKKRNLKTFSRKNGKKNKSKRKIFRRNKTQKRRGVSLLTKIFNPNFVLYGAKEFSGEEILEYTKKNSESNLSACIQENLSWFGSLERSKIYNYQHPESTIYKWKIKQRTKLMVIEKKNKKFFENLFLHNPSSRISPFIQINQEDIKNIEMHHPYLNMTNHGKAWYEFQILYGFTSLDEQYYFLKWITHLLKKNIVKLPFRSRIFDIYLKKKYFVLMNYLEEETNKINRLGIYSLEKSALMNLCILIQNHKTLSNIDGVYIPKQKSFWIVYSGIYNLIEEVVLFNPHKNLEYVGKE